MTTAALNILDELYLHLDRDDEPWSVQVEVGVEGRIDAGRLRDAIAAGMEKHPIARARLRPRRATDRRYHWEIDDDPGEPPLAEVECEDDDALRAAREEAMGVSLPIEEGPPFAVTLAHHPDGDAVMLNLNHAAGDGMSAVRLLGSFLRVYAGEDDPDGPVDPLAVRSIRDLAGERSLKARTERLGALAEQMPRLVSSPVRVAAAGGEDRAGYGFELAALGPEDVDRLRAHRADGATVNDVLLAALAVTVRRWNAAHDGEEGIAAVMMPVNLRPKDWFTEVVGNFASYVSVRFDPEEQVDLPTAVRAARARTRRIKEQGAAGFMVDLLEVPTAMLPQALKQRLQDLILVTGSRLVDTTVLSNLGKLDDVPHLGDAGGAVTRIWFSPPGRMPLGASVGAATYGGELFLTLRYRHALFDAEHAAAFMRQFRDVLTG